MLPAGQLFWLLLIGLWLFSSHNNVCSVEVQSDKPGFCYTIGHRVKYHRVYRNVTVRISTKEYLIRTVYKIVMQPQVHNESYDDTYHIPKCCRGYSQVTSADGLQCEPICSLCENGKCIGPDQCSCDAGYWGTSCNNPCNPGYFGKSCSGKCNCASNGVTEERCDGVTGECLCKEGWKGARCEVACSAKRFGRNCLQSCDHCADSCNATGSCQCPRGWMGDQCDQHCPNGTYGVGCANRCYCSANQSVCDSETGRCECFPGFYGDLCDLPCPPATFGVLCRQVCDCNGDTCDPVTGACKCSSDSVDGSCAPLVAVDSANKLAMGIGIGVVAVIIVSALVLAAVILLCRRLRDKRDSVLPFAWSRRTTEDLDETMDSDKRPRSTLPSVTELSNGMYPSLRLRPVPDVPGNKATLHSQRSVISAISTNSIKAMAEKLQHEPRDSQLDGDSVYDEIVDNEYNLPNDTYAEPKRDSQYLAGYMAPDKVDATSPRRRLSYSKANNDDSPADSLSNLASPASSRRQNEYQAGLVPLHPPSHPPPLPPPPLPPLKPADSVTNRVTFLEGVLPAQPPPATFPVNGKPSGVAPVVLAEVDSIDSDELLLQEPVEIHI